MRLVRSHNDARGLDDVMFRRDRPEVVDRIRAGTTQRFSPAAIVKEQHPAAILQHSFMSRRHGDRMSVIILTCVGEGHETNDAAHRRILAKS